MISSVSAVSFRNNSVQDLINTPGKFSNGARSKAVTNFNSRPKRDEEPEGKSWAGYAAAGLALIGVIAGLGYAVKTKLLTNKTSVYGVGGGSQCAAAKRHYICTLICIFKT